MTEKLDEFHKHVSAELHGAMQGLRQGIAECRKEAQEAQQNGFPEVANYKLGVMHASDRLLHRLRETIDGLAADYNELRKGENL